MFAGSDPTIIEATDAAIEILGMSHDELRALPPGTMSLEEDKAGREGFSRTPGRRRERLARIERARREPPRYEVG